MAAMALLFAIYLIRPSPFIIMDEVDAPLDEANTDRFNELLQEIKKILATDREWTLCIAGMGNLGSALVENENFRARGYKFVAAFDSDPKKIGKKLPCGLIIESTDHIRKTVRARRVEIGVITTPRTAAQRIAELLMDAGVKAILNFAPVQVRPRKCCTVENVDFTVKLENLAYHLGKTR